MHDLTGTVIAVLDQPLQAHDGLTALATAGYRAELLEGEEGRAHLAGDGEDGLTAMIKRLVLAFGDQVRILDRLDQALAAGHLVVSVDVDSDQAQDVARILEDHGGRDMWRLGEWSFSRIGENG